VGVPDQEWGEAVTAFVVLKPTGLASEPDIIAYCRERLAGYKKPRAVHFVDSLPRSHYGKILRPALVSIALDRRARAG
jgi:acyl-CoA synthetase (AMP-forming)/AMP-acid ligase II